MHDEFRLRIQAQSPGEVLDALKSIGPEDPSGRELGRLALTHEGDHVFLYADSAEAAEAARSVVQAALAKHDLAGEVNLSRWHPIEERWEDASVAVPVTEPEIRAEQERGEQTLAADAGDPAHPEWEVRITLPTHQEARSFAERLEGEGIPVKQRWRHLLIGAATQRDAQALAERLRTEAPQGSEITPEGSEVLFWNALHPFALFGGIAN